MMQATHGDPIVTEGFMEFNDLAWQKSVEISKTWRDGLFNKEVYQEVGHIIIQHRGGPLEELFNPRKGAFNLIFRMKFLDGGSAVLRFPIPGVSMFPEEKVQREVSVMRFIERKPFQEIGSITNQEDNDFDDEWIPMHRPLTMNMNELVQLGGVPPHLLPQTTFKTASAYFLSLAEMHMTHLSMQRNNVIDYAKDCRRKYIARCLFRKLARENRLCSYDKGPFKLFCDDFRPANVLANSQHGFKAVGAIDWEFAYAAPVEFVYSPPSWLLLERPEFWKGGLDDWTQVFEKRLVVFLEELQKQEHDLIERGVLAEENRLSLHMMESWKKGDFWVCYAARRSWAFDMVYWAKIDRRFFGTGDLEDRLRLLTSEEREALDAFVQKKLMEKEQCSLIDEHI
ncbi:hypothetical protein PISL3812_02864 [Talaromyces islandicus]|uniref:Aminoglycoside phosphotransferase domain-containing protein n=1 Tax=Talaromyces islandicus TaxID=28573 RepID=A0A0U1LTC8_TALIS|nr:hypothetical protein PISL3812_02864 [Talaromyces islandicus]